MNKINLSVNELEILKEIILSPLRDFSVEIYFFGSRATGKNHEFSDVDILIKTNDDLTKMRKKISEIKESLEESNFPYKVDLVFEQDLVESYKEEILTQAIKFLPTNFNF